MSRGVVLALFIVIIIILVFNAQLQGALRAGTSERFAAPKAPQDYPLYTGEPVARTWDKPYMQLTAGEQTQFIIDTYYSLNSETNDDTIAKQDAYINSLPTDGSCGDKYTDCAKWAANGECTINPAYMLDNCAGSCQSCALTPQQKYNLMQIYATRPISQNVYHGEPYPGPHKYLSQLNR